MDHKQWVIAHRKIRRYIEYDVQLQGNANTNPRSMLRRQYLDLLNIANEYFDIDCTCRTRYRNHRKAILLLMLRYFNFKARFMIHIMRFAPDTVRHYAGEARRDLQGYVEPFYTIYNGLEKYYLKEMARRMNEKSSERNKGRTN